MLEQQLQQAQTEGVAAGEHLSTQQDRQQRARQARRRLSHGDHSFDLDNVRPLDEEDVGRRLVGHFLGTFHPEVQADLERKAQSCADLFA